MRRGQAALPLFAAIGNDEGDMDTEKKDVRIAVKQIVKPVVLFRRFHGNSSQLFACIHFRTLFQIRKRYCISIAQVPYRIPQDVKYIPRNVDRWHQNFLAIRDVGGVELTNDVWMRKPNDTTVWFIGKLARVSGKYRHNDMVIMMMMMMMTTIVMLYSAFCPSMKVDSVPVVAAAVLVKNECLFQYPAHGLFVDLFDLVSIRVHSCVWPLVHIYTFRCQQGQGSV